MWNIHRIVGLKTRATVLYRNIYGTKLSFLNLTENESEVTGLVNINL